jgi:hypothetical protein
MRVSVASSSVLSSAPQNSALAFLFPQGLYDLSGKDSMGQDWKISFPSSTAMAGSTSEQTLLLGFSLAKHLSPLSSLFRQVRQWLDPRVRPPLGLLVLTV